MLRAVSRLTAPLGVAVALPSRLLLGPGIRHTPIRVGQRFGSSVAGEGGRLACRFAG